MSTITERVDALFKQWDTPASPGCVLAVIKDKGLNFKPGSEYLYSNSGYFLLGIIAQRVTGKHITELIQEHILDPLGMKHTTFNNDFRPIVKNRAMSYEPGEEEGTFINALALSGGFGDGAILTNVKDLLLWDRNFYNNKLNNAQSDLIEQLHCTGKLNNGESLSYAFGLFVDTYNGQKVVRHGGGWAGYRTELMRFPDQHFSVICISNLGNVDPTILCQQVADIYLEEVFKKRMPKLRELSNREMESLTGIFQGKHSTVEISAKGNTLHCNNGFHESSLRVIGKRKFQLEDQLVHLSFSGKESNILNISEPGEPAIKHKRVQKERSSPPALAAYEGKYFSKDLGAQYMITAQGNELQLKRTPYDKPISLIPFTENTFLCNVGELRLQYKNGVAKGFTLNAGRVTNIKFKKVK